MDIPNDKSQQSAAPTPMNSLANGGLVNPGTSVAPRVATLGEEDESGANPASMLSRNPNFLSLLAQNQQGADAGSLPPAIRKRVQGLQGVQAEHAKIESEFQLEILALEKKFAVRYAPLYQRRSDIVSGASEPTEAELAAGADEDDDDENDAAGAAASSDEDKGIPDFWLIALRNHVGISELITEEDEDALHHLRDIQLSYLEATKPGFKLTFVFDANEYFENTQLEKVYYYQEEVGYGGDLVYDRAEGTEIIWKEDKDLTRKVEIKKQRNKTTNRTRVVKVVKPSDSFFNFFKPPTPPTAEQLETSDVDEAELQELDERLELDYQIGEDLKERIIPRAVDYFSGKALEYDGLDDESDDEFDEDEDAYGTDDEDDDAPRQQPAPGSQDPQECKQQ